MKKCCSCKMKKELKDFNKNKNTPDGHKAYCRDCSKKASKKYTKDNWDKIIKRINDFRTNNLEKYIFQRTKARAKTDNIEFNIEISDIIIPEYCPYLKIKLDMVNGAKGRQDNAPSIDRIDSTRGYVKGNIEIISDKANRMKNNATARELLEFALSIIEKVPSEQYYSL